MPQERRQTYDFICFTDLAYEFDVADKKEVERRIKRRLKYHKLGNYNQERVDYIRDLKNDLHQEISLRAESKYFNKSASKYAHPADFNLEKMKIDFLSKYDKISDPDMTGILNFAVYLYHLR